MKIREENRYATRKLLVFMVAAALLACTVLLASCSKEPLPEVFPEPEPGPKISTTESVIGNIPEGSVLLFQDNEGAAKLIKDMEEGRIPVACRGMYDEMGARPEVEITDPKLVTEAYNRVGHMIIGDRTDESITDCYHYVYFELQDGTKVGWNFEGGGILCWGYDNYEVLETGGIWGMIRELQDGMMEEEQ